MSRKLKADQTRLRKSRENGITTGSYKRFDSAAFEKHNHSAVTAVIEYLDSVDIWAQPNPDRYGPDIVVWHGFRPTNYIEVAQRSAWVQGDWPTAWNPIHIEERKLHLFNSLQLPCEYWVVRCDAKVALIIGDASIRSCNDVSIVPNAVIPDGEKFLRVPIELTIQKNLTPGEL